MYHITATEVLRSVVLNWAHIHIWVVGQHWLFGELLAAQKHVEWVATVIRLVDFLDFNGVVRKEVVKPVELVTTIVAGVRPNDGERQNASVII